MSGMVSKASHHLGTELAHFVWLRSVPQLGHPTSDEVMGTELAHFVWLRSVPQLSGDSYG